MTTDEAVDWWPALSPDGRSLAWLKIPVVPPNTPVIDDAALYVCPLRERSGRWSCANESAVTKIGTSSTALAWTPDSKAVLYAAPTASGATDIFSIRVDGTGTPVNLTSDEPYVDNQPTVSPDGRSFIYSRAGDLYLRAISTAAAHCDSPADLGRPTASTTARTTRPTGHRSPSRATATATTTST